MSNKPEFKNQYITIWPPNQYGRQIVIEKRYKDKKTEEWKATNKYFENELPKIFEALKEAMQHLGVPSNEEALENITNTFDDDSIPF